MPNQEQQREDKLLTAAEKVREEFLSSSNSILDHLIAFAKSPEVAAFHRTPVEVEQPNLIDVGNIVINKLKQDEYWDNPRNRKTRIVVELMMRECYLMGWNNRPHLQPSGESEAWISVEDVKPTEYGSYLVFRKNNKIQFETWNNTGWAYNNNDITHWQPLAVPKTQTT